MGWKPLFYFVLLFSCFGLFWGEKHQHHHHYCLIVLGRGGGGASVQVCALDTALLFNDEYLKCPRFILRVEGNGACSNTLEAQTPKPNYRNTCLSEVTMPKCVC